MSPLLLLAALLTAPVPAAGSVMDTSVASTRVATPAAPVAPARNEGPMVDSVVVRKHAHTLSLYYNGLLVRRYRVALGGGGGDKVSAGDRRTPEGNFRVDYRNASSQFYRALHLDYPDSAHAVRAIQQGVSPGGDIMIHGLPNWNRGAASYHVKTDWTNGCVAVTNDEMDELFRIVPVGTPVKIIP
jgi:murein L,D-transpeptidase YafK